MPRLLAMRLLVTESAEGPRAWMKLLSAGMSRAKGITSLSAALEPDPLLLPLRRRLRTLLLLDSPFLCVCPCPHPEDTDEADMRLHRKNHPRPRFVGMLETHDHRESINHFTQHTMDSHPCFLSVKILRAVDGEDKFGTSYTVRNTCLIDVISSKFHVESFNPEKTTVMPGRFVTFERLGVVSTVTGVHSAGDPITCVL